MQDPDDAEIDFQYSSIADYINADYEQQGGVYNHGFEADSQGYVRTSNIENEFDDQSSDDELVGKEAVRAKGDPSRVQQAVKRWDVFAEREEDAGTSYSEDTKWRPVFICMRLVSAIVFFGAVAATALVSRLSLLVMAYNIRPNDFAVKQYHVKKHEPFSLQWVWGLVLVTAAPYFFTAVSCLWKMIFKKTQPLRCLPLLAALVVETLHSVGLCLLVFHLLPSFDPLIGCFLVLNVGFFPGLIKVFQTQNKAQDERDNDSSGPGEPNARDESRELTSDATSISRTAVNMVMLLLQVATMSVWMWRAYVQLRSTSLTVLIPVSLLLVSLSWWDNYISGKKPSKGKQASKWLTVLKRAIKKRRTKILFVTSLWKIILTIGLPALWFGYGSEDCVKAFFQFYDEQNGGGKQVEKCSVFRSYTYDPSRRIIGWYPLIMASVNISCSIVCYKVAKAACKVLLQVPSFVIPVLLVTPLSIIAVVGGYINPIYFKDLLGKSDVPWVDMGFAELLQFLRAFTTTYWVPAGFAAYLSLAFIAGHTWSPRVERMARTDKLFCKPLYCGVLLEQSLLLNRRMDEDDPSEHMASGKWADNTRDAERQFEALEVAKDKLRKDTTPFIHICATMWHESETEMIMMLKSIFRLDIDQSARRSAQLFFKVTDPDYYEFEAHIFFDDAFEAHGDDDSSYTVNSFVKQLVRVVDTAASAVHKTDLHIPKPRKVPTPYGGRLVWKLPGGNTLTAHLKDKAKIRHRKRWSQVMYMYYFLGYRLVGDESLSLKSQKLRAQHTFLLALDGDVDFQPEAIKILVDRMKQNPLLGAACGRIHPIGAGPMVWYQKFEYAVSHWLQKATEHVLGCVLCSPGCFSLFRGAALMDDNVMKRYTTPPTEARHYVQYDQGEDRWLCTLLLQQGYRVEYCAASDSYTFAPEGFYEFYNQRRRWTPSTMANIIDLLSDWRNTTKRNQDISVLYMMYQLFVLCSGIITPGTIFLLIVGAISSATADIIPLYGAMLLNVLPIAFFVILCFKADTSTQLAYASILSLVYTIIMMLVLVGLIKQAADNGFCSVSTTFLLGVAAIFVLTAALHPMECAALLHGCLYFISIPSMSLLLMIYSLANLHVVSWGTREVKTAAPPLASKLPEKSKGDNSGFLKSTLAKLTDAGSSESDYNFSFGNLCRCLCCPRDGASATDMKLKAILQSLSDLDSKVTELTNGSVGDVTLGDVSDIDKDSSRPVSPAPNYQPFSKTAEQFEGGINVDRKNPIFKDAVNEIRNELINPKWSEDEDLGDGQRERTTEDETEFWATLIQQYLFPLDKDEQQEKKTKEELLDLRNKMCLAFFLINSLFVVLVSTLQLISEKTTNLSLKIPCAENRAFTGEKVEPISVAFTLVFGILLTLQFFAMLFHRFSTLLQIISITEIKVRKLTRQVLGMEEGDSQALTVEETINLVREMQALRPDTPTDLDPDSLKDLVTPEGTMGARSGSDLWEKLRARRKKGVVREHTLSKAFLRNYDKLAQQIRSDNNADQTLADSDKDFRNLDRKSRKTIVKVFRDDTHKEHIVKRSAEAKSLWRRGIGKVMGQGTRFRDIVRKTLTEEQEDHLDFEEEQEDSRRQSPAVSRNASPKATPLMRRFVRQMKQARDSQTDPVTSARHAAPSPSHSVRSHQGRQQGPTDFLQDERGFLRPPQASFRFPVDEEDDPLYRSIASPRVIPHSPSLGGASPRIAPGSPSLGGASPRIAPGSPSLGGASPRIAPGSPSLGGASPRIAPGSPSLGGASTYLTPTSLGPGAAPPRMTPGSPSLRTVSRDVTRTPPSSRDASLRPGLDTPGADRSPPPPTPPVSRAAASIPTLAFSPDGDPSDVSTSSPFMGSRFPYNDKGDNDSDDNDRGDNDNDDNDMGGNIDTHSLPDSANVFEM